MGRMQNDYNGLYLGQYSSLFLKWRGYALILIHYIAPAVVLFNIGSNIFKD